MFQRTILALRDETRNRRRTAKNNKRKQNKGKPVVTVHLLIHVLELGNSRRITTIRLKRNQAKYFSSSVIVQHLLYLSTFKLFLDWGT